MVSDTVVVEVKAVQAVAPVHTAQLLTYLKLARYPVGLLINFNVPVLKDGVSRRLNKEQRLRSSETDAQDSDQPGARRPPAGC